MILSFELLKLMLVLTLSISSMEAKESSALFQESKSLDGEIEFVKGSFAGFGFFPKSEELVAYRGEGRCPEELREAGGFFRKAFGDTTKIPSYRVDGGVRHMIGCSKDFNVAAGFAKYSVDVQRGLQKPSDSGWVYAFFLPSDSYYDPTDYPYAFLGDWGEELDAIFIPFDYIIGSIQVESPENACIHSYLTRIPERLHSIRGCSTAYVSQIELKICGLWLNADISASLCQEKMERIQQKLKAMYQEGVYLVKPQDENSRHALRVTEKYDAYFPLCAPYPYKDTDLTARLTPEPIIEYIEDVL